MKKLCCVEDGTRAITRVGIWYRFLCFQCTQQGIRREKLFMYITSRKARQEIKVGVSETKIMYFSSFFQLFSAAKRKAWKTENGFRFIADFPPRICVVLIQAEKKSTRKWRKSMRWKCFHLEWGCFVSIRIISFQLYIMLCDQQTTSPPSRMLVVASSRKSFMYFIMCVTTGEQGRMKIIGLLPLEKFYKFWTTAQLMRSRGKREQERERKRGTTKRVWLMVNTI